MSMTPTRMTPNIITMSKKRREPQVRRFIFVKEAAQLIRISSCHPQNLQKPRAAEVRLHSRIPRIRSRDERRDPRPPRNLRRPLKGRLQSMLKKMPKSRPSPSLKDNMVANINLQQQQDKTSTTTMEAITEIILPKLQQHERKVRRRRRRHMANNSLKFNRNNSTIVNMDPASKRMTLRLRKTLPQSNIPTTMDITIDV